MNDNASINTISTHTANNLMDKVVSIENCFANLAEEARNPIHFINEPQSEKDIEWIYASDFFNYLRNKFGLQSYQEALSDTKFTLKHSKNPTSLHYAKKDLKDLEKIQMKHAKYVVPNSQQHSIVPASIYHDILPFLKELESHDKIFKNVLNK